MNTDRLVKVANNRYLDPSDPLFVDKLMAEFPHLKLSVAEQYLADARAATAIKETTPNGLKKPVIDVKELKAKNREGYMIAIFKWVLTIMLFILVMMLLYLFTLKYNESKNTVDAAPPQPSVTSTVSIPMSTLTTLGDVKASSPMLVTSQVSASTIAEWVANNIGFPLSVGGSSSTEKPLNVDEAALKTAVLRTAVENYHAAHGTYPPNASFLDGETPENWLSFIPTDMNYVVDGNNYRVYPNGFDPNCTCRPSTLSLAFFYETSQLALMQGNTVLSVYPVASAMPGSELPYTESMVTERVVNPNGGNGVYGKRALALEQNYAIHGTNDQASIGKRVSHGCLRMKDTDIAELYPYVPLGTPFKVKSGKPDSPMYPKGLPDLGEKPNVPAESKPNTHYNWHY